VVVLRHVADLHVLVIERVVLAHQLERYFMLEVLPLPPDLLVRLG
jgi:hypothetical protein